jgi:hypothetical protein
MEEFTNHWYKYKITIIINSIQLKLSKMKHKLSHYFKVIIEIFHKIKKKKNKKKKKKNLTIKN